MLERSRTVKHYFRRPMLERYSIKRYPPSPKDCPPWRLKMTCCIAAACQMDDEPRIVLCSDLRLETLEAGAENELKFRWAASNWPALIAGEVSKAEALLQTYLAYRIERKGVPLHDQNLLKEFQVPAQIQKRKAIENYVRSQLGISYSEFLRHGNKGLDPEVFRDMLYQIRTLLLGCELLIVGFTADGARILRVDQDCSISWQVNFCAIGTGTSIASAALFQREQSYDLSLEETIYNVYEAQRLAQIAPGVGKELAINVIGPPKRKGGLITEFALTDDGERYLERQYRKHGLKPVKNIKLERAYLERIDS